MGDVADYRSNSPGSSFTVPCHTYVTNNKYNSLNQKTESTTPDGGITSFWYNAIGKLVASQNAKQLAYATDGYTYNKYDELTRTSEVGEAITSTPLTNAIAINSTSFASWLSSATKDEVTRSIYDNTVSSTINGYFGSGGPLNLHNRLATQIYQSSYNASNTVYDNATHYSYDIHGNITSLVQDYPSGWGQKKIDYEYDLVGGKVNKVSYQDGEADAFYHIYDYDADNRLTKVYTSHYGIRSPLTSDCKGLWNLEAKYFYYAYGPLARMELGDKQVQGVDYAYTINGWLKGMNSNTLRAHRDIGRDADLTASGTKYHLNFATDAFGFTLNYNGSGDYEGINSIGGVNHFEAAYIGLGNSFEANLKPLYNGNISAMVTAMLDNNQDELIVHGNLYQSDQLNRLRETAVYTSTDVAVYNTWATAATTTSNSYKESYTYDRNGNIISLERWGSGGVKMDELDYTYETYANGYTSNPNNTNRLRHVDDDAALSGNFTSDFDDPSASFSIGTENYDYDEIGNLIADATYSISAIDWTLYGNIHSLTRTSGSTKKDLEFLYDGQGNRILKKSSPHSGGGATVYTWYVRDAQGHIMANYEKEVKSGGIGCATYTLIAQTERPIYGSSRIGVDNKYVILEDCPMLSGDDIIRRKLGEKQFELSNHLNDVYVTISDRKLAVNAGGTISYWKPDVVSYNSLYSFGMSQPNRNGNITSYRYSFNSKEDDSEVEGQQDYGLRLYDKLLARFKSVDPLIQEFPWYSPYL